MEREKRQPKYIYPWDALEADLRSSDEEAFQLIAYGSLVNPESAAHTLKGSPGPSGLPVIAYGVKRVFNYLIPSSHHTRYGPPETPFACAALNTIYTGCAEDTVNGLLLAISIQDIPAFRKREVGYDLYEVPFRPWARQQEEPSLAHILVCTEQEMPEGSLSLREIEPHRRYYQVCRRGVARIGPDFLEAWLANTYLADGVTPVGEWEKKAFPDGFG